MTKIEKLKFNNEYLAYRKHSSSEKNAPNVIFLSGYMSDMEGSKAVFLHDLCAKKDYNFIRFDYLGTGSSSGDILDCSISLWKENAKAIINELGGNNNIIIGSSMGGWIMLLLALEMPEKINSLIGLASAPDFTEKLIWDALDKNAQQQIMEKGLYKLPTEYCDDPNGENSCYPLTKLLIEDGRKNLIFSRKDKLSIDVPVTLIHGMKDADVPYGFSIDLAEKLISKNVEVILQPKGKHRMGEPENLSLLQEVLENHIISYGSIT